MDLLKKNLTFSVLTVLCLLAFAIGSYFVLAEAGTVKSAKKQINNAETQLQSLLNADPAPSVENLAASEQNVEQLEGKLEEIREELQRGASINASTDGVRVMAGIQQYITDYQRKFKTHTDEEGADQPIELPENFAFGFEKYITDATPPQDKAIAASLDKQRQILSYILDQLIEANPIGVNKVQREVLEEEGTRVARGQDRTSTFKINPAVSARVPGAIDTMAFSVTFTGYTDSLRSFLNSLAEFELPIVVRSVEVERSTTNATPEQATGGQNGGLSGIFGAASETATSEASRKAQEPIISEVASTFTVTLEFIEITLPSDSEENPS